MDLLEIPSASPGRDAVRALVQTRKVLVCVGSGGVGKTTTAAALGLLGASLGRKTLVITIDPAKRLANALGLDALSHAPQRIDANIMKAAGAQPTAELYAMMLDLKAAWDDMLMRTAPDEETAKKILTNRFYGSLSRDLPGAHEFIACEALHHLASSGAWDLVVLDTPPTSNALDFLEAPARILAVLDNEAFRFFAQKKQMLGLRFLDGAAGRAQSVLARFAGSEVLEEMGDFIVLLRDLYDPLTQRTRDFMALLRGEHTRFLVVASPQPAALSEARFFLGELGRRDLRTGALIINRVTPSPGRALEVLGRTHGLVEELRAAGVTDGTLSEPAALLLASVLEAAVGQQQQLADLDGRHVADLEEGATSVPIVKIPRLPDAVHDVRRLVEMIPWLAG